MGKRKCIGILYNYNEGWIGGTYYIENIVAALSFLPDNKQPLLKIYSSTKKEFDGLIKKIPYRHVKYISLQERYTLLERIINRISRLVLHRNLIDKKAKSTDFAFVFPNPNHYFFDAVCDKKKVYWIPDFQEDHLPHFFSPEEIISRKKEQQLLSDTAHHIVFSSHDACNDFTRLYPNSKARKIVLPFAVKPLMDESTLDFDEILTKYNIPSSYILIPNQLWIHKNHLTVIDAAKKLKDKGLSFSFIFTGKDSDYRFPDYPQELYFRVEKLHLTENIKFLGFIPKEDLAALMQNCRAIIQPSLFEGWSTVIEEAKRMNKYIFASNIPIHNEQLDNYHNKSIFEKESSDALVDAINQFYDNPPIIEKYCYENDFKRFGEAILKIV